LKGLVKLAVDNHEYIIRVLIRKITIKRGGGLSPRGGEVGRLEVVKPLAGWRLMKCSLVGG
jgi:hypothetical protein